MIRLLFGVLIIPSVIVAQLNSGNPHPPPLPPGTNFSVLFGGTAGPNVPWRTRATQKIVPTDPTTTTPDPITTASPTVPSTSEPTTLEPSTVASSTVESTTIEPTTIEPTTVEPSTVEPTTVASSTEELSTVESTTVESTTVEVTTVEPTTVESTTVELSTFEPSTVEPSTAEPTTVDPPATPSTDEPSTVGNVGMGASSTVSPTGKSRGIAAGRVNLRYLPNGQKIADLPSNFQTFPGQNKWSQIVANNKTIYVLNPVQTNDGKSYIYDPWTIGEVLGYLYEVAEFGKVPPKGGYTISLMGKKVPKRWKRFPSSKTRRAALVFTPKSMKFSDEDRYWDDVLANPQ